VISHFRYSGVSGIEALTERLRSLANSLVAALEWRFRRLATIAIYRSLSMSVRSDSVFSQNAKIILPLHEALSQSIPARSTQMEQL